MAKKTRNLEATRIGLAGWLLIWNSLMLFLVFGLLGAIIWIGWGIYVVLTRTPLGSFPTYVSFFALTALLLFFFVGLFLLMVILGSLFGTYIMVDKRGLEYRSWPFHWVRCRWNEIERKAQFGFGPVAYDVLYFSSYETLGLQITTKFRRFLGFKPLTWLPLTTMRGYPRGKFADLLNAKIPEIMNHSGKS